MPGYVHLSDEHTEVNARRKDPKSPHIVRNLKPHKITKTNFIYPGYPQDIAGGFKITRRGLEIAQEYFRVQGKPGQLAGLFRA